MRVKETAGQNVIRSPSSLHPLEWPQMKRWLEWKTAADYPLTWALLCDCHSQTARSRDPRRGAR